MTDHRVHRVIVVWRRRDDGCLVRSSLLIAAKTSGDAGEEAERWVAQYSDAPVRRCSIYPLDAVHAEYEHEVLT